MASRPEKPYEPGWKDYLSASLTDEINKKTQKIQERRQIQETLPAYRKYFPIEEEFKAFGKLALDNPKLADDLLKGKMQEYQKEKERADELQRSKIASELNKEMFPELSSTEKKFQDAEPIAPDEEGLNKTQIEEKRTTELKDSISAPYNNEIASLERAKLKTNNLLSAGVLKPEKASAIIDNINARIDGKKTARDNTVNTGIYRDNKLKLQEENQTFNQKEAVDNRFINQWKVFAPGIDNGNKKANEKANAAHNDLETINKLELYQGTGKLPGPIQTVFAEAAEKIFNTKLPFLYGKYGAAYNAELKNFFKDIKNIFPGQIREFEINIIKNAIPLLNNSSAARELINMSLKSGSEMKIAEAKIRNNLRAEIIKNKDIDGMTNFDEEVNKRMSVVRKTAGEEFIAKVHAMRDETDTFALKSITPEKLMKEGYSPGDEIGVGTKRYKIEDKYLLRPIGDYSPDEE